MRIKTKKKVIIVGAGLAGLSLATELVDAGFEVLVLEKNPFLGGRASNSRDKKMHDPIPIGPHVFVTAYNNLRRFFKKIGATNMIDWERKVFLDILYNGQRQELDNSRLPKEIYMIPWLAHYKFLTLHDKVSNIKIMARISISRVQTLEKFDNITAHTFLKRYGVSEGSINKFWRFLVLSLLNIPLEKCSAAEFALLLKHWTQLNHPKFGFAKNGLGDIYTKNCEQYIRRRGGVVRRGVDVREIVIRGGKAKGVRVMHQGRELLIGADIVVSAVNPLQLRYALPRKLLMTRFFRGLKFFKAVPYISVNLWFNKKLTAKKFWTLLNDSRHSLYLNTDFYDQSNIYNSRKSRSYITSNIIYSSDYAKLPDSQIVSETLLELRQAFPDFSAKLLHQHVHRIPYVVYAPIPGMRKCKLSTKTPIANFYLAGDWIMKETQCMETAVRSGYKAAETILADYGINKKIYDPAVN